MSDPQSDPLEAMLARYRPAEAPPNLLKAVEQAALHPHRRVPAAFVSAAAGILLAAALRAAASGAIVLALLLATAKGY